MVKVLVVAQLPPPYLGQPIMLANLVGSKLPDIEWYHVPMQLSDEVSDVGAFKWSKIFRLLPILIRMLYARLVWKPDVLYFAPAAANRMSMFRDFVILIPARLLFPRTVFHFHASGHSTMYPKLRAWQKWLFRRVYFHAEGVIRLSELTPPDGEVLEARREFIVPNGIEDPAADEMPRSTAHFVTNDNPLRLLFVGSIQEGKGVLVLLDACGQLVKRKVPFRLDIMGRFLSDEFEALVHERIAQLDLGKRVRILGQLTGIEKFAAFDRSDVMCHPTFHDTLPIVLIEAMGLGLPVVSTNYSGIPSIVVDGETGFLVPTHDPIGVADRIVQLANDAPLRDRMGIAARRRFEQEFTLTRHLERMRDVFLVVAGSHQSARPETMAAARVAAASVSVITAGGP